VVGLGGRRARLAIFAIALGVRLGAIAIGGAKIVSFGDGGDFLATADHLCRTHGYPDRGNLPFFRAPLLPFFVAATTLCHPERVAIVKVALAACDSATVLVIGEIAWLLFGSPGTAKVAALVAACDPFFILGVTDVRTEPLFMFFLTTAIWWFLRSVRGHDAWSALVSGAAFALSALARPAGLAAVALAGITLLLAGRTGRTRWAQSGALALGASLVLLPWVTRNALRYGELIVVNDAAGFSFWRGTHPEMDRIARIKDPAQYRRAASVFENDLTPSAARAIDAPGLSPQERSRAWLAAGLENIRQDPVGALKFAGRRAWRYWRPWLNPQEYGGAAVASSAGLNMLLYAVAVVGLALYWKQDRFVTVWVIVYFLFICLAHIPHQVVMRFRIPFTDPLLIGFAASAAVKFMGASTLRPHLVFRDPASPSSSTLVGISPETFEKEISIERTPDVRRSESSPCPGANERGDCPVPC